MADGSSRKSLPNHPFTHYMERFAALRNSQTVWNR
jgi:hypothetical protein